MLCILPRLYLNHACYPMTGDEQMAKNLKTRIGKMETQYKSHHLQCLKTSLIYP